MNNKKIIHEKEKQYIDGLYKRITYEDGEVVLKTFDSEFETWVTIKFQRPLA